MCLDVISDWSKLSPADILADVRDSLLNTAGDVVASICHASGDNVLNEHMFRFCPYNSDHW